MTWSWRLRRLDFDSLITGNASNWTTVVARRIVLEISGYYWSKSWTLATVMV
jgi:hypothetical protein